MSQILALAQRLQNAEDTIRSLEASLPSSNTLSNPSTTPVAIDTSIITESQPPHSSPQQNAAELAEAITSDTVDQLPDQNIIESSQRFSHGLEVAQDNSAAQVSDLSVDADGQVSLASPQLTIDMLLRSYIQCP